MIGNIFLVKICFFFEVIGCVIFVKVEFFNGVGNFFKDCVVLNMIEVVE